MTALYDKPRIISGKIKCRNCTKVFVIKVTKLAFGVLDEKGEKLLNSMLDEVVFKFKCPYCNEETLVNVEFITNGFPKFTQIIDKPTYIG